MLTTPVHFLVLKVLERVSRFVCSITFPGTELRLIGQMFQDSIVFLLGAEHSSFNNSSLLLLEKDPLI